MDSPNLRPAIHYRTLAAGAIALLMVIAVRAPMLGEPFDHGLESGFQEALALQHVRLGWAQTLGLTATGEVDGQVIRHLSHPPLLQNIYAIGYTVFGFHEWVSRVVALGAQLATIVLIGLLAARMKGRSRIEPGVAMLTAALIPAAILYGGTAAFATVATFWIVLTCWLYARWWEVQTSGRLAAWLAALLAGMWTEWTVYLLAPLMVLDLWRRRREPGRWAGLIALVILTTVSFVGYCALNLWLTGEIEMLSHAGSRSGHGSIFSDGGPGRLVDVLLLGGGPVWGLLIFFGWAKPKGAAAYRAAAVRPLWFWLLYVLLMPRLVLEHPFETYYLVPWAAIGAATVLAGFVHRYRRYFVALAALAIVAAGIQAIGEYREDRNDHFYLLSRWLKAERPEAQTMYSMAAVGHFTLYGDLRTLWALGVPRPPIDEMIVEGELDLLYLDRANADTRGQAERILRWVRGRREWTRLALFSGAEVWGRGAPRQTVELTTMEFQTGMRQEAQTVEWPADAPGWARPRMEMVAPTAKPEYALVQHALPDPHGAAVVAWPNLVITSGMHWRGRVMLSTAPEASRADGVELQVRVLDRAGRAQEWKRAIAREEAGRWIELEGRLAEAAGGLGRMELIVKKNENADYDRVMWADLAVIQTESE